jgi:predicted PurR-regulated permease PerM
MFTPKFIFWIFVFAVIGAFAFLVHKILMPFVLAFFISYLLSPLVDKIENKKVPRTLATILSLGCFIAFFVFIIANIAPLVRDQVAAFIEHIPHYSKFIMLKAVPYLHEKINLLNPYIADKAKIALEDMASSFLGYMGYFITDLFKSGFAIVNVISFIFISPIIAFYTLRDWNNIREKFYDLFPQKHRKTIIQQFKRINIVLANFLRGQTTVCVFLAAFYSIGLTLTGLEFGLFVGLATGVLCFIPYAGVFTGATIAITLAFIQFSDIKSVLYVVLVFACGQFIEGNFITPKVVGEKVGLHPVVIFFAFFSGGLLFGFLGALFAIPMAAILGVIVQFLLQQYKASVYYKG